MTQRKTGSTKASVVRITESRPKNRRERWWFHRLLSPTVSQDTSLRLEDSLHV